MTSTTTINTTKIRSSRFYGEYHGHRVEDLEVLHRALRPTASSSATASGSSNGNPLIWTAGDSSLDNKYWFHDERPAVEGGYASVLEPPVSNADVTYWLNYHLYERQRRNKGGSNTATTTATASTIPTAAINAAVEATTLNERTWRLRPQDRFLRDHLQPQDILVVSVGGNDVAMAPTPCTIASILCLTSLPLACLDQGCVRGTVPLDDCCFGCGASLGSCLCACPPCLGYMIHLFGTRVEKYIQQLTSITKPRLVMVLMIYFPDETPTLSWAGPALACLGYDRNPQKLQTLIRRAFVEGTSKISVHGTLIVPVPLFQVLDGTQPRDYVARVEPSSQGGRKMAEYLLDMLNAKSSSSSTAGAEQMGRVMYGSTASASLSSSSGPGAPVESSYMADRS